MSGFSLTEWDEVGDVVDRALRLPVEEREALLAGAYPASDPRLTAARRVLEAAAAARGFLDRPAAELVHDLLGSPADRGDGVTDRLGAYRLHGRIGRGGMADVFLADRADDEFRREVAVKVVRTGLGLDLVQRFRAERQILASFEHPNVARLYDGGVTHDGRPFLVMEYVDGRPIDVFADARRLSVDARLALFLQLCDAVERAHRHLVVHRDLKPANILVTSDGSVKLLDFGVSKLLDPAAATEGAPLTRGVRLMTPEYASPEQFTGDTVTTATDVYSAGVVLYELLTGRRPHEDAEGDVATLQQRVLDGDIEAPSAACRADGPRETAAQRAGARSVTVDQLTRELRGDLDNIVATALNRDPARRYPSMSVFRNDVERYRAGLPVAARPATVGYRAAKFLRRHRVGVGMVTLLVAIAVAGAVSTLTQARAAAREGRRAAEIRDFLVSVFEVSDPDSSRGEAVTARELLDRGSARIDRGLGADPALRADMRAVVGALYRRLGLFDRAASHLEAALGDARTLGAPRATLIVRLTELASVRSELGDSHAAELLLVEALSLARAEEGDEGQTIAGVLSDLAGLHRGRAEFVRAEALAREAVEIRRAGADPAGLASALNGLGVSLKDAGRPLDAVPVLEEALAVGRGAHGDLHSGVALIVCNLAAARHGAGLLDAALVDFRSCVDQRRRLLGDRHPDVGLALANMALVHSDRNEYDEAERLYTEALSIQRASFGNRHRAVAATLNNLAILDFQRSRYRQAAERFRELIEVWRAVLGPDHPDTWTTTNNLGMALRSAGEFGEAERILRDVLAARQRLFGPRHPQTAESMLNLASVLQRQHGYQQSRQLASTALAVLQRAYPDGHPMVAIALVAMGRALLGERRGREAVASFERAVVLRTALFGETHLQTAEARVGRGLALAAVGRVADGRREIETALAHMVASGHSSSQTARDAAEALARLGGRPWTR